MKPFNGRTKRVHLKKNHSAILFEMNWQRAKEVVKAKTEETGVFMLKFW